MAGRSTPTNFIEGVRTWASNGGPDNFTGVAIHLYRDNHYVKDHYFYNADSELLLVSQQGCFQLATELGLMDLKPLQIGYFLGHMLSS